MITRKRHEYVQFLCRRLYPQKINAIGDEVTADAAGLLAAFGEYRSAPVLRLLGIQEGQYIGGRLENYVSREPRAGGAGTLLPDLVCRISEFAPRHAGNAFALAVELEERKEDIEAAIAPKPSGDGRKETEDES